MEWGAWGTLIVLISAAIGALLPTARGFTVPALPALPLCSRFRVLRRSPSGGPLPARVFEPFTLCNSPVCSVLVIGVPVRAWGVLR